MEKSTKYGLAIFVMILAGGLFLIGGEGEEKITGNAVAAPTLDGVQEKILGMKGPNYFPDTFKVNAGQPVRVKLDDSVYGCFRDFTIKDLGVKKYLRTAEDYVEFTPEKPGTYTFACSMGMGYGKLIVE